ncbi:MAG: site-specific integrase [Desulfobacterales bacterium]|nr:site-specific integrase [Desulfobacterales bacterium]
MYLKKPIGDIPITDLKRAAVLKALRGVRSAGLSRSSVEAARNVISGTCEFAIDYELLTSNPCAGIMKRMGLQRKMDRKPIVVFTKEEVSKILETCKRIRPDFYPLFLAAFRTGMRLGELLALKWENINWNGRYIVIESSFRNSRLTSTKTGKARSVEMSNQLYEELKALYAKRKKEALKAGSNEVVPIVFHTKGDYTSQNSARNIWRRILTKAKLDYRKLHCIRHTFASLLIADGHSLAFIKDAMGHGSIQITVDVYGHLLPSESRGAVNTLDDAPKRTLSAPAENENAATQEDYGIIPSVVAMQGFEPRTLRI